MYKVSYPCIVHFDDEIIAKTIGMGTIVVKKLKVDQTKRICIKDVIHMFELELNLFFL